MFAVALLGGAAIRVITMLGYPGVLWFTGDSYFYLGYALRPQPSASKTLGYSFPLRLLEPFHSFTLVAALQHLMGLAVAILLYALLRRSGLPGWAATLVTVPVLFDPYQVELEHLLMAEPLFSFLITAAVTALLWRRQPVWWIALAAGLLLGYAVLVRTAGAAMLPAAVGCLVVRRAGWRACTATVVGGLVPLAAYAVWFHSEWGTYGLTTSDGVYLWGRTSSFAQCDRIRPPADERFLCVSTPPRDRVPPGTFIWRSEAPVRQMNGSPATVENNKLLRDFAVRAIMAQPGDYLVTVVKGVGLAVGPHRHEYPNRTTEALYHFTDRPQLFPGGKSWGGGGGTAYSDAARYGRTSAPSRVVEPYAGFMRSVQRHVFLPGPALGALLVVGAAGVLLARGRRTEVLTAWGTSMTLLVFPIATADFDYRYVLPAVPFACLAAGYVLASGREIIRWSGIPGSRRRRDSPEPEEPSPEAEKLPASAP